MSFSAAGFLAGLNGGIAAQRENGRGTGQIQKQRGILSFLGLDSPTQPGAVNSQTGGGMNPAAPAGPMLPQSGQAMAPQTSQNGGMAPGPMNPAAPQQAPAQALARPQPTATGIRGPSIAFAPEVDSAITTAVQKYGVDPVYMRRMAEIESSGDPTRKNKNSSAGGLYQFVDGTANRYGLADRYDPMQAADAAARLTLDNQKHLKATLGRDPTPGELYLAHQQGGGGAAALLRDPTANAVDALTNGVYKGNRRRALAAIKLNGGRPDMTAGDFAAKWTGKFEPKDHSAVRAALAKIRG